MYITILLERSKFITHILLTFVLVCGWSFTTSANAQSDSTIVHKFLISYPINDTELHEDYLDNKSALRTIRKHFINSPKIDSIVIYSYASPEGPYWLNKRLAKDRGERARRYLLEQMASYRNFPESLIIVKPTAENWEGLLDMIGQYYPYSDKQEVLDMLTRKDMSNNKKKELLKKINEGRPWRYIRSEILPNLRYATWIAEWAQVPDFTRHAPVLEAIKSKVKAELLHDTGLAPMTKLAAEPQTGSKTILALKSNLLYDALSLINFSVEVPFWKNNMSLLYYHQFPWWTWGQANNEFCVRFLSIGGEARWWFKTKDRLNGHFLGAYGESGKYDFEYQRNICYQGEFYSAGLSYGYAMPIGRHLNMEFSISAGYASIAYRGYTPSEDYEILWRDPNKVGRLHYFGPTKAQISLVVPIRVKTKGGNGR